MMADWLMKIILEVSCALCDRSVDANKNNVLASSKSPSLQGWMAKTGLALVFWLSPSKNTVLRTYPIVLKRAGRYPVIRMFRYWRIPQSRFRYVKSFKGKQFCSESAYSRMESRQSTIPGDPSYWIGPEVCGRGHMRWRIDRCCLSYLCSIVNGCETKGTKRDAHMINWEACTEVDSFIYLSQ